ncbi:trypsin alpha-3-like [Drosophila hydei]|uniref:trypsin n=1 Tax=Drosophila hydei TaxID=7224 RepID=A0A6J1M363_DROHY|nr:trypsin alpha-3-like [Drosophila hydei]
MAMYLALLALLLTTASLLSARELFSKRVGSRIVNGQEIDIALVPWQVALRRLDRNRCGGSIYSPNIVITAAHCVSDKKVRQYSVRAGSSNAYEGGQFIAVDSIWLHEHYYRITLENDIAVVRLAEPLELGTLVQPIRLATQSPPNEAPAYVSGWGYTGYLIPDYLHGVDLKIVSYEQCKKYYTPRGLFKDMICALERWKDACWGDCGGPLVSNGELVGIVSWGSDCTKPVKQPGVYANVAYFHDWLLKAIESLETNLTHI